MGRRSVRGCDADRDADLEHRRARRDPGADFEVLFALPYLDAALAVVVTVAGKEVVVSPVTDGPGSAAGRSAATIGGCASAYASQADSGDG